MIRSEIWCRKNDDRSATTAPLSHHGQDADGGLARFFVSCRGDDDERAGRGQRGKARCSFYHIASVEGELARQCAVGGQVHWCFDGKADGVASVHEELSRVAGDGKRRG